MADPWHVRRFHAPDARTIAGIRLDGEYEEEALQRLVHLSVDGEGVWAINPAEFVASADGYPHDLRAIGSFGGAKRLVVLDQYGTVFDALGSDEVTAARDHFPDRYLDGRLLRGTTTGALVVGGDDQFYKVTETGWSYLGGYYLSQFPQQPVVNHDVETNPAFNFWYAAADVGQHGFLIAGWRGRILHWDGTRFVDLSYSDGQTPEGELTFTDVLAVSPDEIYVCGYDSLRARGPSLILKGSLAAGFEPVVETRDGRAFFSMTRYQGKVLVADFSQTHGGVHELDDGNLIPFLPDELSDFRGASYVAGFDDALWVAGPHEVLRLADGVWARHPIPDEMD